MYSLYLTPSLLEQVCNNFTIVEVWHKTPGTTTEDEVMDVQCTLESTCACVYVHVYATCTCTCAYMLYSLYIHVYMQMVAIEAVVYTIVLSVVCYVQT